jgi:hypothetical protein
MENIIICPSMSKLCWGLRSVDSCWLLLISLTGGQVDTLQRGLNLPKVKVRVMQTQVSGLISSCYVGTYKQRLAAYQAILAVSQSIFEAFTIQE